MTSSLQHKESYMTKLNMELTDNIKDIREVSVNHSTLPSLQCVCVCVCVCVCCSI